ncbi:MAG TPA: type II secretion system F family protein [Pirellulales bacterium]|nr:type II secretion system F family protein [Pirellulales bacterium]
MNFTYTAKNTSGGTASGQLAADSLAEVRQRLREQGLFVLAVQPSAKRALAWRRPRSVRRGRVPKRELLTMTSQLAVMARSGIDLAGALRMLCDQATHPTMKAALEKVHEAISAGKPISAALKEQGHVFGSAYVAGVAAGEASGRLAEVLDRLSQMIRNEMRQGATVKSLLAYPIVLSCVSLLVILGLVLFVLPSFANVFEQLEAPLPALTQILLAGSAELRRRSWLWGSALVALVASAAWHVRSPAGRRRLDSLKLNLTLLRSVTRSLAVGRVFRLLGTMIESGVPLLEALQLTRGSMSNSLYHALFDQLEQAVLNGREMSATLAACPFIPSAAAQMIATGERTGNLASVAQIMGEFYEEEGETRLKELATVLEPLIIVVMGVVVATVVLSVMLPMFDFATMAQSH